MVWAKSGICMACLGDAEESSLVERKRSGMVVLGERGGRGSGWYYLFWFLCTLSAGRSWPVKPSLIFLTSLTGGSVRSARKRKRPWLAASGKTLNPLTLLWMTKQRERHFMNFTGSSSSLFFKKLQSPVGTIFLPLFCVFPWNLLVARGLKLNIFGKKSHSRMKILY